MDYAEVVAMIAPCGLNCGKCVVYHGGEIQQHSAALVDLLGPNFDPYAARFAHMNPVFEHYEGFKTLLSFLAQGSCHTCRQGQCLFTACRVRTCIREKGVDFCFECNEFPCDKHGLNPRLEHVWRQSNGLMKELGVEGFYEKIKDDPRYP